VPVYKRPVFQQSSPKLDLILNINVLESSPSASPFSHFLHKPLRVVSSNTRDFYLFKYSPPVHFLVQVVLSRPIEALTSWSSNPAPRTSVLPTAPSLTTPSAPSTRRLRHGTLINQHASAMISSNSLLTLKLLPSRSQRTPTWRLGSKAHAHAFKPNSAPP